jgi:hypothetical protein
MGLAEVRLVAEAERHSGRSYNHGNALAGNVKGDPLDCRYLDISRPVEFDNIGKTDNRSVCAFGLRNLSQGLRFHFCSRPAMLMI